MTVLLSKALHLFDHSDDIHIEFGLDKCAKIVPTKRKISSFTKLNIWHP